MKKTLRLICALLSLCCVLMTACGRADATSTEPPTGVDEPTVSVSSAHAKAGEKTVEIPISVYNNPGILGMTLTLEFDESILTLKKVDRGDALRELTFTKPKDLSDGCRILWDAESVASSEATNGVAVILTFSVSDTAPPGDYAVIVRNYGDVINNDLEPIKMTFEDGIITVS